MNHIHPAIPTTNAVDLLAARMLSYDGMFDGYPSMSCTDEGLIQAAIEEGLHSGGTEMGFLCWVASERVTTRAQYDACRAFIDDYVTTCWSCNMCEGSNPVQQEIDDEDEG